MKFSTVGCCPGLVSTFVLAAVATSSSAFGGIVNDECSGAIEIFDGETLFSTVGATTSGPELPAECEEGFGLALVDDIWFSYTATQTGILFASTCNNANYDTRMAGYEGDCDNLVFVACNDDGAGCAGFTSILEMLVIEGETYLIRLGGFSTSGDGILTLNYDGPPPVDCPFAKNDCFTTGGPGCSDAECCAAVCELDLFCCQTAWDTICVGEAFDLCGAPECPFDCPPDAADEGEPCGDDTNGGCNAPIGGSDCCTASGGLGCDDLECTIAVCAIDPFCCDTGWDGICADEAADLCGDLCAFQPAFTPIVCGETICGTAWAEGGFRDTDWFEFNTDETVEITITVSGQLDLVFGVIDTGGVPDCSLATTINPFAVTGFCGTGSITTCLGPGTWWLFVGPNGFEGFPCDSGSNNYFISLECAGDCVPPACGNPDSGDCFTANGTPFCDDAECCETVCALDPFCCQTAWDDICADEAFTFCIDCDVTCDPNASPENEACGEDTNGGCNAPAGGSNCCVANGGIGCDDAECQQAVCDFDPFCCETAWDSICAGEAADLCPDLCSFAPALEDIDCGVTICGTGWAEGGLRDTDWFQLELTELTAVTMCATAEFPLVIGVVNTGGIPDCSLATVLDPFATANPCQEACFTACLPAGTWWLFVGPSVFEGFPCGGTGCCGADLNQDGIVDGADLGDLLAAWGTPGGCADLSGDGTVDGADLGMLLAAWNTSPPCESGGSNTYTMTVTCGDPSNCGGPANNFCADAIDIFEGETEFSTVGATTDGPPLPPECDKGFGPALVDDIWYLYTATGTGVLTVSTCDAATYDTRLAAYQGDCNNLELVACNDDGAGCTGFTSIMEVFVEQGETYLIRVGGFSTEGNGTLTLTLN